MEVSPSFATDLLTYTPATSARDLNPQTAHRRRSFDTQSDLLSKAFGKPDRTESAGLTTDTWVRSPGAENPAVLLETILNRKITELNPSAPTREGNSPMTYGDLEQMIEDTYGIPVDGVFGGFYRSTDSRISDEVDNAKLDDYFSPEKTSERIVTFATSFMDAYSSIHPESPKIQLLSDFRTLIEDAIDSGFNEALGVLGNLPDEVQSVMDETRSLITQKLDDYFSRLSDEQSIPQAQETEALS